MRQNQRQSIIPIIFEEGTLFFEQVGKEQLLKLKDLTEYKSGRHGDVWHWDKRRN